MKLEEVRQIGLDCGLSTWDEALDNIEIHFATFFTYNEAKYKLESIRKEFKKSNLSIDDFL